MRQSRSIPGGHSDQFVLSLIDDIYAAALDPGLWTGVVKRVVESVGGVNGQLVSPTEHVLTRLWAPYGFDPDVMVPYARYYHALDVWTQAGDASGQPPCRIFTGEELIDFKAFKRTEYYNDFLKPFGFERIVYTAEGFHHEQEQNYAFDTGGGLGHVRLPGVHCGHQHRITCRNAGRRHRTRPCVH